MGEEAARREGQEGRKVEVVTDRSTKKLDPEGRRKAPLRLSDRARARLKQAGAITRLRNNPAIQKRS